MSEPVPQRLLTAPLVVFLLVVAGIIATAVAFRAETPDMEGAIELLADGDLDRAERDSLLLRVLDFGESAKASRGRWAAVLAAVALQDRGAFDRLKARLDEAGDPVVPAERRQWLSLGDPLLANLLAAMQAEAAGDGAVARLKWRQVMVQSRFVGNAVAARLAEEAQVRMQ